MIPVIVAGIFLGGCGNPKLSRQSSNRRPSTKVDRSSRRSNKGENNVNIKHDNSEVRNRGSMHQIRRQIKGHQSNAEAGIPKINLGSKIVGQEDRGAGQIYITFNMRKWSITVHGNDVNQKRQLTVQQARQIVAYLQTHTLPVPDSRGTIMIDTEADSSQLTWDHGHKVHRLNGPTKSILRKATH